ncbi:MAG TPA: MBL fold metallo-hydrolase [Polyangiaceae bacterium]|nr:MBL fold metallo-hydrolase [Polyangiaceae bacterium]
MSIFVRFWGTRGSIPTPGHKTRTFGGNTSCVELRIDESLFICDGGTGLRELGVELGSKNQQGLEVHMFFSHTHWDHIQGFPFFLPAYAKQNSLIVYDVGKDDDRVHRLLKGQMQTDYFPVNFSELGAKIRSAFLQFEPQLIDGVRVAAFEQAHPGRSFAYSFEKNGTKIVYATDNELDATLLNRDESLRDRRLLRQIPEAFVRFVAGADLLIADGQYTDEEYPGKVGWGHARAKTAVDLAVQAKVKQCAIFHHDPMHADELVDHMIQDCRERAAEFGSDVLIFGAREGLTLKL